MKFPYEAVLHLIQNVDVLSLREQWMLNRLFSCRLFVHSYNPDLISDPFGEEGSIWSFNYFFYNKKLKRIVFFTCRAYRYLGLGVDWVGESEWIIDVVTLLVSTWPHEHTLTNFKSKFQASLTFEVVSITNQIFNILFGYAYCLYLKFIKSICQVNVKIFKFNLRLKYFVSLCSRGQMVVDEEWSEHGFC